MNPFMDFGHNSPNDETTDTPTPQPRNTRNGFLTEAESALLHPCQPEHDPPHYLQVADREAEVDAPDYMNMDHQIPIPEPPATPSIRDRESQDSEQRMNVDMSDRVLFGRPVYIDDRETEAFVMHESLRTEIERLEREVDVRTEQIIMLKDHHAVELVQVRNEQSELHQKIIKERGKLEQQRRELAVMLEEISGGLETFEGFERRKETERDRLLAEDSLRKPETDYVHIAVAGARNSGRSSFINSIRGLSSSSVGTNEHRGVVAPVGGLGIRGPGERGYQDPRPNMKHLLWYDLPSPVGLAVDPWDYFNSEGMFAYDAIVLVLNDSGMVDITDISILQQARYRRYPIPVFLVRMKADIEVRNRMCDLGWGSGRGVDGDVKDEGYWERSAMAKDVYCETARGMVESTLARYRGLDPEKRVYLVAREELMEAAARMHQASQSSGLQRLFLRQEALGPRLVDEESLLRDLTRAVNRIWATKCREVGRPVPPPPMQLLQAPGVPFSRDMVVLTAPSAASPRAPSESDYELV